MMTGHGVPHAAGSGRWRFAGWTAAVGLLLLPFVAMQFTREVNWSAADFVIFAIMLFVPAAVFDLLSRRGGLAYRLGAGAALATLFLLVWVNLAVGIIGSEDNPANLMYAGVIALLVGGGIVTRCRASGMVRVLGLTAIGQILVCAIALTFDLHGGDAVQTRVIAGASGVFVLLWLLSAALFWRAAAE